MPKPSMCLPLSEWPELDARLWRRGTEESRLLSGVATRWRQSTRNNVIKGYGYALAWLAQHGHLHPTLPPQLRWPPERISAYAEALMVRVRPATAKIRILLLERALAVLAPNSDRSSLRMVVQSIAVPPDDGRKRNRLQDPERLVTLGIELMNKAEQGFHKNLRKNAALYRDGLQIALLALRGFRRGNLTSIRIGTHLTHRNDAWWLKFKGEETKNHRPIEVPFPEMLLQHLNRYLEHYRPLLAGRRYTGDRLWVTYRYRAQPPHSIGYQIVHQTKQAFGRPINPHLFRDCIATSIAIHDPINVRMAATILGHGTFATTERHYNLARSLDASRAFSEVVTARREAAKKLHTRKPRS
jgi:integrase/recombinase XerD